MRITLDFWPLLVQWHLLLVGTAWTIGLTVIAMVLGGVIGTLCAFARAKGPRPLAFATATYVELIRNTPFIVQLFFIFFGLPAAGFKLTPLAASILAMTLNLGAYATEIIRAGILATPRGQIEAGISLALSRHQIFTHVILPPALKRVWPALVSQIIIVMLGSAVCSQISMEELSHAANLIQSRNFRAFEAYIVATTIYLGLAILMRRLLGWIGPRFIFGR